MSDITTQPMPVPAEVVTEPTATPMHQATVTSPQSERNNAAVQAEAKVTATSFCDRAQAFIDAEIAASNHASITSLLRVWSGAIAHFRALL